MGKLPAFQFYPNDWRSDPELCRCSKSARDTWMDMLCLMFFCEERGVLATNRVPWPDQEVAAAVRGPVDANLSDIRELLAKGVARRRDDGAIYCLRMVRDEQERQKTKKRVGDYRERKSNATCNGDVTPEKRRCTEEEDVERSKEVLVGFKTQLPADDGDWERLIAAHPKPEQSYLAQNRFFEAVNWKAEKAKISHKEAANFIVERAQAYSSICRFQKGLTKWLEEKIFEQPDRAWGEIKPSIVVSAKNPALEMRRQLEAD